MSQGEKERHPLPENLPTNWFFRNCAIVIASEAWQSTHKMTFLKKKINYFQKSSKKLPLLTKKFVNYSI